MTIEKQITEVERRLDHERNGPRGTEINWAGPCSHFDRYRGKFPPRCGCAACWEVWDDRRAERIALLEHRLGELRKQKDCNHRDHFSCPPVKGKVLHKCFSCRWEWETEVSTTIH